LRNRQLKSEAECEEVAEVISNSNDSHLPTSLQVRITTLAKTKAVRIEARSFSARQPTDTQQSHSARCLSTVRTGNGTYTYRMHNQFTQRFRGFRDGAP
jgi:hypothetical protein